MKLASLALAGCLTSCLPLIAVLGGESRDEGAARETFSAGPAAAEVADQSVRPTEPPSFAATIVTGNRTRQFDSPARAMSELHRAVWLMRRSGQEDSLIFEAVLTVNGVEHEFSSPDQARAACGAVVDALQRLARVRAGLNDVGMIPAAEQREGSSRDETSERPTDAPRQATLSVRQRVNQALDQEVPRPQSRVPEQKQRQQIVAPQTSRAPREALAADDAAADGMPAVHSDASTSPGAALEARRQAEIDAVRRMLARAFSAGARSEVAGTGQSERAPATASIKGAQ